MTSLTLLYHLAHADFLERVRRSSFLVILVLALYMGYVYLPNNQSGYITVSVGNARGIYNSAWVGAVCSLMSSGFVSLIGFFLIKNAVGRDYQTRVGQILASTPMTKFLYLLGKAVSNFAVLFAVMLAILASAAVMQVIRGESSSINPWQLAAPSLFFAMPFLMIISALAVLFEVTPVLKGTWGNVIYVFVWNAFLITSMLTVDESSAVIVRGVNDPAGFSQLFAQITQAANAAIPNLKNIHSMGILFTDRAASQMTFVWGGVDWTPALVIQRLVWVLVAFGIVIAATPIFQRFDAVDLSKDRKKTTSIDTEEVPRVLARADTNSHLTPLTEELRFSLFAMIRVEIGLLYRTVNKWWLLVAAGLALTTLLVPLSVARHFIFPFAWIWPLSLWSSMGTRERKFGTEQLLFSCPKALTYQLSAIWIAGIVLAAATGCAMVIRLIVAGEVTGLAACIVGMVFIPTMALAFGALSGGQMLFEAIYVGLWYIGPMNQVPFLDFMGASPKTSIGNTLVFAVATLLLWIVAFAARKRQLASR